MAPTLSGLVARQFGDNDRFDRDSSRMSTIAIVGIVISVLFVLSIVGLLIWLRVRQRRKAMRTLIQLSSTTHTNKPTPSAAANTTTSSKYGGSQAGYGSTPDQNQALLGNAEAPAIVTWGPSHSDALGSTQDGFGYDNSLHLAGGGAGIQRPASVATFSAPPPRYEEATNHSAPSTAGLRPSSQGEAASYFNTAIPMGSSSSNAGAGAGAGAERGRSRSREPAAADGGSRGRGLSIDDRSINGDRRRSISRFREEGMMDVPVDRKG